MIHLIVGNTGAGKSTYANRISKKTGAIVFSIDEWNKSLFLEDKGEKDGLDWMLERIERSEKMIWSLCVQLDMQSQDAVLDLGFAKYNHREKIRKLAKENEIECKLHFLDFSKEVRKKRVLERNENKGATYVFDVDDEMFDFMEDWFENPSENELKGAVIIDENQLNKEKGKSFYIDELSKRHSQELNFCIRLANGVDNGVQMDTLRTYVIDYWEKIMSVYFDDESSLFEDLDKSNQKVESFYTGQEELSSMIKSIKNSDSVSSKYLLVLVEKIKNQIRFKDRSFYPYILEEYDDITLRSIKEHVESNRMDKHEFSPVFWEKS